MTIFLELNKAFDTVDHRTLIDKLMKYGIKRIDYLTGEEIEYLLQKLKIAAARVRVIISGVYREETALRTEMNEKPLRTFGHVWRPPSNTPDQRHEYLNKRQLRRRMRVTLPILIENGLLEAGELHKQLQVRPQHLEKSNKANGET